MKIEVKITKGAKYRKFDVLDFSWDTHFKPRVVRWKPEWTWKPNTVCIEDITGDVAVIDTERGELRRLK